MNDSNLTHAFDHVFSKQRGFVGELAVLAEPPLQAESCDHTATNQPLSADDHWKVFWKQCGINQEECERIDQNGGFWVG